MPEMIGSPPNCRPECVVNSDCSQELACISRKCQDPCPGLCGINAYCRVRNHVPICVCNQGYQGDPFSRCNRITSKHWQCGTKHASNILFNQPPLGGQRSLILATRLLVAPTLCAMKETRRRPVRVCLVFKETLTLSASQSARSTKSVRPTWLASDKSVRILVLEFVAHTPHALSTTTTPSANVTLAMREIPSPIATEKQHVSNCMNFLSFNLNLPVPPRVEPIDPCNPSPCGSNAVCNRQRNAGSCQCIPEYFGDPYVACRPECVVHSDCPSNKACQRNKCIDPCPGTCGINAQCQVRSHSPTCTCIPNYIGDPFTACRLKPLRE